METLWGGLHLVVLEPDGNVYPRRLIGMSVPQYLDGLDEMINDANEHKYGVAFFCETREQAIEMAAQAEVLLPDHHRITLEIFGHMN